MVLLSVFSRSAVADFKSAITVWLALFWPTQVCFSVWSCLSSVSNFAVVSASAAVVAPSSSSKSPAVALQSAMSVRLALFVPMQVCFSSWHVFIAAEVSCASLAFATAFVASCVCSSARVSTHSVIKSCAAFDSPTHRCLSAWHVSISEVSSVVVFSNAPCVVWSFAANTEAFSLTSAKSAACAADSPTHFCFSPWHDLIVRSHVSTVASSFAVVALRLVSSAPKVFFKSPMMVSDSA